MAFESKTASTIRSSGEEILVSFEEDEPDSKCKSDDSIPLDALLMKKNSVSLKTTNQILIRESRNSSDDSIPLDALLMKNISSPVQDDRIQNNESRHSSAQPSPLDALLMKKFCLFRRRRQNPKNECRHSCARVKNSIFF
ncbi:hypothetical protein AVEN_156677-1 [Araneus ventricosus]|uniref:Uncharacterized protein n=1 Tax=Araneus ventricosus TaxID=182803 RepID=A0A4Y2QMS7_ARAVE|nr:hypothetical protein AVEN_156677-1 [Araneus ventricosus]